MFLGCRFGHQQKYQQTDGLLIWRVKTDGMTQQKHSRHRRFEAFDAAMRDGDAVPQPGGAQALAGEQTVSHQGATQTMEVLKQKTRFFKRAFFAAGINADQHLGHRENTGESVHGE